MGFGTIQAVLRSHRIDSAPADEPLVRPDQVLIGPEDAPLVASMLERAGVASLHVRPALTSPGRGGLAGADSEPDWVSTALDLGFLLPRPGRGDLLALHRERLAAPGRLVLCTGRLPECGAVGMLALRVDALAAAAALAVGSHLGEAPRVLSVELSGALRPGVGGVDLALALLARIRNEDPRIEAIELSGPGVEALPMADRWSAAWVLAEASRAGLFPSDDRTRAALGAWGREEEWRRLDGCESSADRIWRVDLAALESCVAPLEDLESGRPLQAWESESIERVLVGPGATTSDWARIASALEASGRGAHVACTILAGSRGQLDRAIEIGLVDRLTALGVSIAEGEASAHAACAGTGLCVGVPRAAVTSGRGRWLLAGSRIAAFAAAHGTLAGSGCAPAAAIEIPDGGVDHDPWLSGPAGSVAERFAAPVEPSPGVPADARGAVLARLGDDVRGEDLLPRGARLDGLRARISSLAAQVLSGSVPDFAARARARRGGFLVAGSGFGGGDGLVPAALCLDELGVRAVIADSYAPHAARTLTHAGVVPLLRTPAARSHAFACGDELELPGLFERLRPGAPLEARNLTRGTRIALRHELTVREIAILRSGGLVAFVRRAHSARGEA